MAEYSQYTSYTADFSIKTFAHLKIIALFVEDKEQVLANLANFAYDPSNMEALQMLQVTELFLDMLTEENENFVEFGIGKFVMLKSHSVIDQFFVYLKKSFRMCVW